MAAAEAVVMDEGGLAPEEALRPTVVVDEEDGPATGADGAPGLTHAQRRAAAHAARQRRKRAQKGAREAEGRPPASTD